MCVCVRACVRACARVRVCACARVWVCGCVGVCVWGCVCVSACGAFLFVDQGGPTGGQGRRTFSAGDADPPLLGSEDL